MNLPMRSIAHHACPKLAIKFYGFDILLAFGGSLLFKVLKGHFKTWAVNERLALN